MAFLLLQAAINESAFAVRSRPIQGQRKNYDIAVPIFLIQLCFTELILIFCAG
jgi:hypothetical protein